MKFSKSYESWANIKSGDGLKKFKIWKDKWLRTLQKIRGIILNKTKL
jgi:hypothetical protein